MEIIYDFLHGKMIAGFQGPFAGAKNLADLRIFHFIEVTHRENRALHFRQTGDSRLKLGLCLVAVKVFVGQEAVGNGRRRVACRAELLLTAQKVKCLVVGNAVQPRQQAGPVFEFVQVVPCLQERVLQDVIGILVLQHDMANLPIQRLAVLSDQQREALSAGLRVTEQRQYLSLVSFQK